ncbi:tail protein X [Pseudoalteromonas sp. R3]|uniref:tail protein X n=1 Tax=Pseudoalteromonas sp. R3 TaxID=1709477 RepID=UPI0006B53A45|nr:tail protein X [Pseudoalteromonas sp. R3]AZZ98014.1 phage tail protein [Pseudoalteromonas sp. R3]
MSATQAVYSAQGDTVDAICYRHYGSTAGITEQVISANAHIAKLPPVLPTNTLVVLPELSRLASPNLIKLWD